MIVAFREVFEQRLEKLEKQLEAETFVKAYKPLLLQEIEQLKETIEKLSE